MIPPISNTSPYTYAGDIQKKEDKKQSDISDISKSPEKKQISTDNKKTKADSLKNTASSAEKEIFLSEDGDRLELTKSLTGYSRQELKRLYLEGDISKNKYEHEVERRDELQKSESAETEKREIFDNDTEKSSFEKEKKEEITLDKRNKENVDVNLSTEQKKIETKTAEKNKTDDNEEKKKTEKHEESEKAENRFKRIYDSINLKDEILTNNLSIDTAYSDDSSNTFSAAERVNMIETISTDRSLTQKNMQQYMTLENDFKFIMG